MIKETTAKLAFIDWENSNQNSLQPFHVFTTDASSFHLFEHFAFLLNCTYFLSLKKKKPQIISFQS